MFCNLLKMCIYYLRNAISCGSRFKSNDFLQRLFQLHKFAMICTDMNSQVASCPSQLHPSYPCLKKMTYCVYTLKPKEMVSNFEIMFSCLPKWCNTINCKLCIHISSNPQKMNHCKFYNFATSIQGEDPFFCANRSLHIGLCHLIRPRLVHGSGLFHFRTANNNVKHNDFRDKMQRKQDASRICK